MDAAPQPPPVAQPGQWVRWRHPRLALARGWFNAYGPGPFQVVRFGGGNNGTGAVTYIVQTALGERPLSSLWVGPAR